MTFPTIDPVWSSVFGVATGTVGFLLGSINARHRLRRHRALRPEPDDLPRSIEEELDSAVTGWMRNRGVRGDSAPVARVARTSLRHAYALRSQRKEN